MQGNKAAQKAWLERVLGIPLSEAGNDVSAGDTPGATRRPIPDEISTTRAREGLPPKGRGVAYRKLLLRWREAQMTLDANLQTVGATLLAQPDVKADPRFEDVKRAVAALPKLVPAFGGKLEDVLDAAMSASDPVERARLEADGVAAIDAYRAQLAAVKPLLELEQFAADELGAPLPLHGALDQALIELKSQLAG